MQNEAYKIIHNQVTQPAAKHNQMDEWYVKIKIHESSGLASEQDSTVLRLTLKRNLSYQVIHAQDSSVI